MWLLLACVARVPAPVDPGDTSTPDTARSRDSTTDTSDSARDSARPDTARDSAPDTADSARDTGSTVAVPVTGPCDTYASAVAMGTVDDTALDELSGLAVSRQNPGILWTHEDSGGAADLYAIDAMGATVATVHLDGVTNHDWEDIALGPCGDTWCLMVGEIGTASFDHSLLVLEEPLLLESEYTITPEIRPFSYPGDAEDAEGLALFPDGTPLVVTKRSDSTAGLYTLPAGATVLEWQADIATGGKGEGLAAMATAADLSTDGASLLVRTYLHLYTVDATDRTAPGVPESVSFALELQGEAVAWDPVQGGFWQVGEWSGATLWYTGCA